ncbi:MAG: hypothetical protein IJD91_01865 [Clostridia bacterium]|nr:hypothetical protein [Clostridia bacterium]
MSKRIVFLYCTQKNKEVLLQYERVIRALLRKFRKSALFSYLQIDPSPACRTKMRDLLQSETSRPGAVFLESDAQNVFSCLDLLKEAFGFYASSHHISGRTIIYAEQKTNSQESNKNVIHTVTYEKDSIKKATNLSLDMAKARKHSLSLCLQQSNELDCVLLREAEIVFGKERHISFEYLSLDEMISLCMKTVPPFDIVLTLKEYAPIIAMHLNSMPDIPAGYIVCYGNSHKVYRRQLLTHEEIGNLRHLSSVLSIAAIFENEFRMKNAANWLKRATLLSFTKEANSTPREFLRSIISEIETPIRKRRTQ